MFSPVADPPQPLLKGNPWGMGGGANLDLFRHGGSLEMPHARLTPRKN